MKRSAPFATLVALTLLLAVPALAVCNDPQTVLVIEVAGVQVEGEVSCQDERLNAIAVLGVGHSINRSWAGGIPGAISYEPITVIKPVDKATPLLFQALTQAQSLEAWVRFYGDPALPGQATFIMHLQNAAIVGMSSSAGEGDAEPTEAISILWQTLRIEDVVNGIEHVYTFGGGGG